MLEVVKAHDTVIAPVVLLMADTVGVMPASFIADTVIDSPDFTGDAPSYNLTFVVMVLAKRTLPVESHAMMSASLSRSIRMASTPSYTVVMLMLLLILLPIV